MTPVDPSDIGVEPLLNDAIDDDGNLKVTTVDSVGAASHRSVINVTATAQEITITTGKKTIEIYNAGGNDIYYGGSGVTSLNGIPIFSNYMKVFSNVKSTFSIYIVCASGETSTLRVVEYA